MIEGVEEFRPELQLPSFRELELFKQTQVDHLDAGAVEFTGSTVPEGTLGRRRKRRRIDQEAGGGIGTGISRRAGKGIPDAVGIDRVGKAQQPVVRSRNAVGAAGLERDDAIELPAAEPAADAIMGREEALPLPEGQVPNEIPNETATNVEIGIAHFGAVVIGVLRQRGGCKVIAKIGQAVTESVTQGVAQPFGHPAA